MLDFHRSHRVLGPASMLLSVIVGGCSFEPPKEEFPGTGGTGGNATSSASSSTSSSTSSTSASSSGSSAENCTNDQDDDMNDATDCADPACQSTYACVNNADDGPGEPWSAPFFAFYTAYSSPDVECASGQMLVRYGINPTEHGCTMCECGLDTLCVGAFLTCYNNGTCDSMTTQEVVNPGCTPILKSSSCEITGVATVDNNAQCKTLSGGELLNPFPFTDKLFRCDTPRNSGGGCPAGQHCEMPPAPNFNLRCIAADGQQTCPAGWPNPYAGHSNALDFRTCECTCDKSMAQCDSTGEFQAFTNVSCINTGVDVFPGGCNPLTSITGIRYTPKAPYLPPDGCKTVEKGQIDLGNETTICCQ